MTEYEQQQLLERAKSACRAMTDYLVNENEALRTRQIEQVDAGLKNKIRLAKDLEKELNALKEAKPHLDENPRMGTEMKSLQSELDFYKTHARQNFVMLQAAHQTTANFMQMVKELVESRQPKSGAYGADGKVNGAGSGNLSVKKAVV